MVGRATSSAVQTRTRNGIALGAIVAVAPAGLALVARSRQAPDLRSRALDAVPSGALLVAVADLAALRASPIGGPLLREGREIEGLGKVRDVCGFDPIDQLDEIALAIPAAGDSGDFGVVAAGAVDGDALLACASKVIEARGGQPVVTSIGSFRSVRDAGLTAPGGEMAVRRGGPVLLGGGGSLRATSPAADHRTPTIRTSAAHGALWREVGDAAVRLTVVLTPEQRNTLVQELELAGADAAAPAASIVAGALGVNVGPTVSLHGVLACADARPCGELGASLARAKDERAGDMATRMLGVGDALDRLRIEADGDRVHARVELPADEARLLLERVLTLRSFRHPMPGDPAPERALPPAASGDPPPDEVIPAPRKADPAGPAHSAAPPPRRDGAGPTGKRSPPPGR